MQQDSTTCKSLLLPSQHIPYAVIDSDGPEHALEVMAGSILIVLDAPRGRNAEALTSQIFACTINSLRFQLDGAIYCLHFGIVQQFPREFSSTNIERAGVLAVRKNEIVAQAQRYAAKGQFEKAIAEYRRIFKSDPSDIRTMLKIGDLYTRMGARKEATDTYLRVAEQYVASGFHLKAIALYKQILALDSTLVTIHKLLATSYLELGLSSEALIQLEQLADVYERTNRSDLLLEVLLQMVSINPRHIATRLRIAELLSMEKRIPEATKHFAMVCEELRAQGRRDDFVKVAERLFYQDPSRLEIASEIAEIYIQQGRYKEALGKLQACFKKNPKDPDILELLASAFRGLEQPEKAISVYEEILEINKGLGNEKKQRAIVEEILLLDPENQKALVILDSFSDSPSAQEDLSLLDSDPTAEISEMESKKPDEESVCQEVMEETRVLIKYGLKERALEHLNKIFNIDPYHLDARERARDILLELNRPEEAIEQLFLLANAFKVAQPEGSVYYLHEILKIDSSNEEARAMIRDIGGIMPEFIDSASGSELNDEDIILIDEDDLEEVDDETTETRALYSVIPEPIGKDGPSINTTNDVDISGHTRVFISYSNDSEVHKKRVLDLAQKLRRDGFNAWIDRFESSPPEGWPRWTRNQLRDATYILVVCSKRYRESFEGKAEVGTGRGVTRAGVLTEAAFYEDDARSLRFIPVLFDDDPMLASSHPGSGNCLKFQ